MASTTIYSLNENATLPVGTVWVYPEYIACIQPLVYVHFLTGYLSVLVGILAFIARLPIKQLRPWHRTIGRVWIMMMYVMPVTAIYIRGGGTPVAIMWFILTCYGSIIIAYAMIRKFQYQCERDPKNKLNLIWMILHAVFMGWANVMLIGAGIAFSTSLVNRLAEGCPNTAVMEMPM
jgi:uncharacterized membrane protein